MENAISDQSNQTVTTNLAKGFFSLASKCKFQMVMLSVSSLLPSRGGNLYYPWLLQVSMHANTHAYNWLRALLLVLLSAVKLDCMPLLRT